LTIIFYEKRAPTQISRGAKGSIEITRHDREKNGKGAERLFRPCMCGIFNMDRATELLEAMVKK
jgi:hypothetical protein